MLTALSLVLSAVLGKQKVWEQIFVYRIGPKELKFQEEIFQEKNFTGTSKSDRRGVTVLFVGG